MIRKAVVTDIEPILVIWKNIRKIDDCLAIPYRSDLLKNIQENRFYVEEQEGSVIGFCGFKIMKRKKIIKIINLSVKPEFRGKHIATRLVEYVFEITKELGLPYFVECKKGAENNTFWAKYGKLVGVKKCKTMDVLLIKLSYDKVKKGIGEKR